MNGEEKRKMKKTRVDWLFIARTCVMELIDWATKEEKLRKANTTVVDNKL